LLPADPLSLLHSDLGIEKLWQMFGDVKGIEADVFLAMIRNTPRLPIVAWHGVTSARVSQIERGLWRQLGERLDCLQVIRDPGINAVHNAAFSAAYRKPWRDRRLVPGVDGARYVGEGLYRVPADYHLRKPVLDLSDVVRRVCIFSTGEHR